MVLCKFTFFSHQKLFLAGKKCIMYFNF